MEGVGARLGRSSTRYGPSTVFTGPVRKWKKKWVHMTPPNSNRHHHAAANATIDGSDGSSHILLYKWTPIAPPQTKDNGNNGDNNGNADSYIDGGVIAEEQPKKKIKYIPIVVLEYQKNESSEQMEDDAKPIEGNTLEETSGSDESHEKPNINDLPMDENQVTPDNRVEWQDLNESILDLSLGLNTNDGKMNQT